MLFRRSAVPGGIICSLIAALHANAAPIASDATYGPQLEDTVLTVPPATGLMAHVAPNGSTGALSVVRVTNAAHGNVALNTDGSFTYTPVANYSGPDSFTYKVIEGAGPIIFTVVPANSVLTVDVTSSVSSTSTNDSDSTTVKVMGTISALLTPTQAPFSMAQVRTADLSTSEPANISLCVLDTFFGCASSLNANLPTDGLSLTMREDQAGPAVPVNGTGVFTQTGNRMDVTGNLVLSGAAVSLLGLPANQSLNTTDMIVDFTNATITQSGSTLSLSMPVDVTQTLTDPNYTVNLRVHGTVRATAAVPAAPPESSVATISLEVTSVDDAPDSAADRYYTRQNYPVSFSGPGAQPLEETLIAAQSVWKYSTIADLGTGWRALDFNDAAWASGAGVLGFDTDNLPIGTTIDRLPAGGGNVYPAAYFRKAITLNAAGATTEAALEFQRDDACIIFVNGTEVYRDSTPYTAGGTAPLAATGEIAYAGYIPASMTPDSDGAVYKRIVLSPSVLREGKNVIAAMVKQSGAASTDLRWDCKMSRTYTPTETLIPQASVWKYSTGANLGTAWRQPGYHDGAWLSGAGVLGYGDPDIVTSIPISNAGGQKFPTAYFRKTFNLTAPFDTLQPRVEVQRDDACVVYLNGTEIYRDSAPYAGSTTAPLPATGEVDYETYAAASNPDEAGYKTIVFSRNLLSEGTNTVAVEVHQNGNASTDLRFDLRAFRTTGVGGVTANDTDVDGPAYNVIVHSPPAHGTVTLQPDGTFQYTPEPGFPASGPSATDSFVYAHRDESGGLFLASSVVFPKGSTWRYLDTGVAGPQDAGITAADWRHPAFDDAAWKSGAGELGYGDTEVTLVDDNPTPGYTLGETNRYITTYFRKSFTYAGSTALLNSLQARIIRDDGVAVWLNGQLIVRNGLPASWDYLTAANQNISGAAETTDYVESNIPASALREGENIIAVEIHQESASSSDISFDMELSAQSVAGAKVEIIVLNDDLDNDNMSDTWERANSIDASVANADADPDGDGQTNRHEFLAGTNPLAGLSVLRTTGLSATANPLLLDLTFNTVPGKTYSIEYSDTLGAWFPAGTTVTAHPTAGSTTTQVLKPAGTPKRFYRAALIGDWD